MSKAAPPIAPAGGVAVATLHRFGAEEVMLERWAPGAVAHLHDHPGGEELFVLEGELHDEAGRYRAGTWLRQPGRSRRAPASTTGALVLVKRGHL